MFTRVPRTTAPVALLTTFVAIALIGCAPTPQPSEPAPLFTSEADAFAAAEKTYRAYVDALNAVDLGDPSTFEAVYALTTGEANAGERRSLSQMSADNWSVDGDTIVLRTNGISTHDDFERVTIQACTDVRAVALLDSGGVSQVSADRPDQQTLRVELVEEPDSRMGLKISSIAGSDQACG